MADPVRVDLKKRDAPDERDTVTISGTERGAPRMVFKAWEQALLPHEAIHAVVEETFELVGFVRLTAAGVSAKRIIEDKQPHAMAAEALTNAFQYELFGMAESGNTALRASLAHMCAHGPDVPPEVSDEQLDMARWRLSELIAAWAQVPSGCHLEIELPALED